MGDPVKRKESRNYIPHWTERDGAEQSGANKREAALLHVLKELGHEGVAQAQKNLGGASIIKLEDEAIRQLDELSSKGVRVRNADGQIITGLLDLEKLGLNPEQAKARYVQNQNEKKTIVAMHLIKELGAELYATATERKGADNLVNEGLRQLETLQQEGEVSLRNGAYIRTGLMDLNKLGLTSEEAKARTEALAAENKPAVNISGGGAEKEGTVHAPINKAIHF